MIHQPGKEDPMSKNIVMIHGMCCGSWIWGNYKRFFEDKGYTCHTPMLRYHDIHPSDKPDPALGTTSLLDYAQDLEEYIHKLDDKPLLMGHSMGGLLSQLLGARGLASGLILLTPASPSGINALKYSVIKSFWSILTKWGFLAESTSFPFQGSSVCHDAFTS
jgi:non-heme chloroperoxidase